MRAVLPLGGGSDGREPHGLRTKVGRMKKLLGLRHNHSVDAHLDTEPGVWLRRFQLLDADGQCEDPVQEWGEEEEDGVVFGITLHREPAFPKLDTADNCAAFIYSQYHTVKLRRLKAGTLEQLVSHLLDPKNQEPDYVHVFLSSYRAFTSPNNLIELLFQRDDLDTCHDNTVYPQSTLLPVIRMWLIEYSADFNEPPKYQALRLLCAHLRRRLCFRRLAQTAESLLKSLQEQDCSRSAPVDDIDTMQQDHRGLLCKEDDKHVFIDFSVRDIAEQLTRLDMELFVQVVPFHCLGCVWSQRDKKENGNLAPSVRATISQFNAVTNRVITSLLCPSSPCPSTSSPISSPGSSLRFLYPLSTPGSPQPFQTSPSCRARIIEWWITVAQECRRLTNFSSLRAILSALQSNAVYRLKKTWATVSKESFATFDHLCETFSDENCVLATREILKEDGTHSEGGIIPSWRSPPLCSKQMQKSGIIPYLGSYLTVLTMLDTAFTDTVEGGLINFEKRRREFEILSQIRQLQASCSHKQIPVNPHITNWLKTHTLLTDQESYELSRELEPPVDPCPSSPNLWSGRLLNKKLPLLRKNSDSSLEKTHTDQISVSSSSSSSSDMDDLSAPQTSPLGLKLKSLSNSMHNITEGYASMSSSFSSCSPSLSSSSCSSSHPDLSCSSMALSPDSSCSSSISTQSVQPVYNKQLADSCIVRVSVECVSNGNVYKSILLTSQDHTPQVIQRALDKHNLDNFNCQDFSLSQMLNNGKELHIPDKANVYYAMCTKANYDFVLHQRWRSHGRHQGSSSSPRAQPVVRQPK
ncbi:ral guanine nucleotide dissociation stimulator-like 1 isoform X1 [Entelurus aequoreus]|uniref:ral guanine nucleotide dissociation stimulator-like 1 isoform X1 n=1 Tax=Entelurus aequoreus TaxID=161455 RepID=UPI002B1D8D56|nr:ral guanine nucleotide dissociation stimulator-like 1 isoform X1 [Entelurus aequoreus]XP_061888981.1 ral guanine nucleotide dissociation stimulator-like 1 isoform X1 [Entelurus aequoreus]